MPIFQIDVYTFLKENQIENPRCAEAPVAVFFAAKFLNWKTDDRLTSGHLWGVLATDRLESLRLLENARDLTIDTGASAALEVRGQEGIQLEILQKGQQDYLLFSRSAPAFLIHFRGTCSFVIDSK